MCPLKCTAQPCAPELPAHPRPARPRGRQQGSRQHPRQQGYPIKPPEQVSEGGRKIKIKKKKGEEERKARLELLGNARAGAAVQQVGLVPRRPAGPSASCTPRISCRGLLVTGGARRAAAHPLLASCFSPAGTASLFALITHSPLLQAAITLVPRGAARTLKKISSNKGF